METADRHSDKGGNALYRTTQDLTLSVAQWCPSGGPDRTGLGSLRSCSEAKVIVPGGVAAASWLNVAMLLFQSDFDWMET